MTIATVALVAASVALAREVIMLLMVIFDLIKHYRR
jgi:hypothetical protein